MNCKHLRKVAITGIGMITPLGHSPSEVLRRIQATHSAAAPPTTFDASVFPCAVCAQVSDFEPRQYVSEPKMVRLMNRDAQLAVGAARLALEDAGVRPGRTHRPEEIGLFGATGLAGLPLREVAPLIRLSSGPTGAFDLARFGQVGLKAVSPVLSFKILSNMPFCFVSINENIQGSNSIYTPWEGSGAQAVEAGLRALWAGDVRCALVGGSDVKTHQLAFASLQQIGLFASWSMTGAGAVPGEGAAFLVLETEPDASARKAHVHGYLSAFGLRVHCKGEDIAETRLEVLKSLNIYQTEVLLSCANGDECQEQQESAALEAAAISVRTRICPKKHVGDLFAATALLQVALGAALTDTGATIVLANCFGHGGTQAAFVLTRA